MEPQEWFEAVDLTDSAAATSRIAREFEGWAPELTALVTDGGAAPVLRTLHTLHVGHRWDRVPGVSEGHGAGSDGTTAQDLIAAFARHEEPR
ncbi:hypothetical protein C5F59_007725 [Streptomyces sp. QL37]|uniref:hypothetical protein n=1 Tax=Streptomyces sp. QL37 TaxID=2093747 RepID=UPI0035BF7378